MKLKLEPTEVRKVYTGRPGCACGCRGNYSEKMVVIKKVLARLEEAAEVETTWDEHGMILFWDLGNRTYSIYMNNPKGVAQ